MLMSTQRITTSIQRHTHSHTMCGKSNNVFLLHIHIICAQTCNYTGNVCLADRWGTLWPINDALLCSKHKTQTDTYIKSNHVNDQDDDDDCPTTLPTSHRKHVYVNSTAHIHTRDSFDHVHVHVSHIIACDVHLRKLSRFFVG